MVGMYVLENVPLSSYSTMRLGGAARYLTDINELSEIPRAISWADAKQLPVIMIGSGSNIVWTDKGFPGLVMVDKISRYEDFAEDEQNHYVTAGGGESWDQVVARTVEAGLSGIEFLSLIPGTVGATPVQNVGAYGQELSNVLVGVEAYDRQTNQFVTLAPSDCAFAYRTSRFKTTDRGRFFITAITMHLMKGNPVPPFYASLDQHLKDKNIQSYTPRIIREAVIAIRTSKLPDPSKVANNGSFFANPVIDSSKLVQLQAAYPQIVYWEVSEGKVKLSAAWLVEQAGFKDVHDQETGMATWPAQPLVLVNEHAHHTADLLKFKQKIINTVQAKFGIVLEQEPELLGV